MWHSREIGQKFFGHAGALPSLTRAMILVFFQIFGSFVSMNLFICWRTHFHVKGGLKYLISSLKILSSPVGFTGLKDVNADIELFKGERLNQSSGLGVTSIS